MTRRACRSIRRSSTLSSMTPASTRWSLPPSTTSSIFWGLSLLLLRPDGCHRRQPLLADPDLPEGPAGRLGLCRQQDGELRAGTRQVLDAECRQRHMGNRRRSQDRRGSPEEAREHRAAHRCRDLVHPCRRLRRPSRRPARYRNGRRPLSARTPPRQEERRRARLSSDCLRARHRFDDGGLRERPARQDQEGACRSTEAGGDLPRPQFRLLPDHRRGRASTGRRRTTC